MIIKFHHKDTEITASNKANVEKMNGNAPLEDEERYHPKIEIVLAPGENKISVREHPHYITHAGHKTNEIGSIEPGAITPAISITGGRSSEDMAQGKKEQKWFPVYYINPRDKSIIGIGYIEWLNARPLNPAAETTTVPNGVQYKPITLQPSQ